MSSPCACAKWEMDSLVFLCILWYHGGDFNGRRPGGPAERNRDETDLERSAGPCAGLFPDSGPRRRGGPDRSRRVPLGRVPGRGAGGPSRTCGLNLSRYGAGENGLYALDSLTEEWVSGEVGGVSLWGSLLLLRTYDYFPQDTETEEYVSTIVVLDLSDGSLRARLDLPGFVSCGFLEDGSLWTTRADTAACEAILYDERYEPRWIWNGEPAEPYGEVSLRFSGDGRYLLSARDGEDQIELIETATGVRTPVALTGSGLWSATSVGSRFYLPQYSGGDLAILDGPTGEVTRWSMDQSNQFLCGPLTVQSGTGLLALSAVGEDGLLLAELPEDSLFTTDYRGGWLLGGSGQVVAVNCLDGSCRTALLPGSSYLSIGALSDLGFAVLSVWEDGSAQKLYLWDYLSGEPQGTGTYYPTGLGGLVDAYAAELEERYGVELYCRGEGNDFDASDYVARFSDNDMQIYSTLRIVDEVLGRLPEGLIGELCSREPRRLRIFLAGALYRTSLSGINTAAAITFTETNGRTVVLDIGQGAEIRSHLPHELSHVLDGYMESVLAEEGLNLDDLWSTGNPGWFSYRMNYNDAYGNTYDDPRDTMDAGDEDNAWFVRGYSKTYPTEDRATVLESMFWGEDGLRGEHLRNKGMLLGAILRHCFASVRASGACWEERFPAGYEAAYADLFESGGQPAEPKG